MCVTDNVPRAGVVVRGKEHRGDEMAPAPKSSSAAREGPHRLKGAVSSTVTPTPGTRPSTPITRPASPACENLSEAVYPTAGHAHQSLPSGNMQQPAHSDAPPLHPAFKASVDAARASVCPELAAARPTLELPQPDFAGKARGSLKRMLGDDMSYIDIKCTARSAAAEAQTEMMAFKRSMTTAAPLVPTRTTPSWHSMEALEDVGVFADACVQEVALRAAQVQSDVSDGVYDLSHTRAQTFRSQAAARSLQQLTSKQTLALVAQNQKHAGDGRLINLVEQDSIQGTHGSNRSGGRLGEKRQSVNPGRKAGHGLTADDQARVRAPLKDGMNVKRGVLESTALRAQAAYERAVDRGRVRPSIAFGRRLEDASQGEARGDAKENGQHAAGPRIDAAVPAIAGGKTGRAAGRPSSGRVNGLPDAGHEAREPNRQEARAPQQSSHRDWCTHERAVPVSGGSDVWDQWGGPHSVLGARGATTPPQHPAHVQSAVSAHGAVHSGNDSTSSDAALVALLQGLTEIIRSNSLAPPAMLLAPQPAWTTQPECQQPQAPPQQLPVLNTTEQRSQRQPVQVDGGAAAAICRADLCASTGHAGIREDHARATTASPTAVLADGFLEDQPQKVSAQSTASTSPVQSTADRPTVATVAALTKHLANRRSQSAVRLRAASATAAWAALGRRTPPKFLSVVDIAVPSTDHDCSSDCGRTSEALGDFSHGVDVEALENLIAASTCASEQGDGQGCPVTLTPEEASILKAVVKDMTSLPAHSAASTGLRGPSQRGEAAGVRAVTEGEWAGVRTSETSPIEKAESVLTMKQAAQAESPQRRSGIVSDISNQQGSAVADSLSRDGDALPAVGVTESGEESVTVHTTVHSTPHESSGGEIEHTCAVGEGPPCAEQDPAEASDRDGAAKHASEMAHERHASSSSPSINTQATGAADLTPASEDGDCEGRPASDSHIRPEAENADHILIAHSVSSQDGSSPSEAQPTGASRRPTLQERIKERYAGVHHAHAQAHACTALLLHPAFLSRFHVTITYLLV